MLQRIQSVYLLVAVLLSGCLIFIVPIWTNADQVAIDMIDIIRTERGLYLAVPVFFLLSALLSIISLFSFKNRAKQITNNRVNIVINFLLLGIIVYRLLNLPGESEISEKGIGMFIPLLVIVCLALANKAIHKDDKLVKSVDRLR